MNLKELLSIFFAPIIKSKQVFFFLLIINTLIVIVFFFLRPNLESNEFVASVRIDHFLLNDHYKVLGSIDKSLSDLNRMNEIVKLVPFRQMIEVFPMKPLSLEETGVTRITQKNRENDLQFFDSLLNQPIFLYDLEDMINSKYSDIENPFSASLIKSRIVVSKNYEFNFNDKLLLTLENKKELKAELYLYEVTKKLLNVFTEDPFISYNSKIDEYIYNNQYVNELILLKKNNSKDLNQNLDSNFISSVDLALKILEKNHNELNFIKNNDMILLNKINDNLVNNKLKVTTKNVSSYLPSLLEFIFLVIFFQFFLFTIIVLFIKYYNTNKRI